MKIEPYQPQVKAAGIRLMRINLGLILLAVLLFALFLYEIIRSSAEERQLQSISEQYIACQQDAALLKETSDLLTDASRTFLQTGEPRFAEMYAQTLQDSDVQAQLNADEALFTLEEDVYYYLEKALSHSDELAKTERYAMRLAQELYGIDALELPDLVSRISLYTGNTKQSPEERLDHARSLLYDAAYQDHKAEIRRLTDKAMNTLAADIRARTEQAEASLSRRRIWQQILVLLLALLAPAIALLYRRLILSPLRDSVRRVGSREAMSIAGAQELRQLAAGYNSMLEENIARNAALSYTASHDALTGLYNRAAYEAAMRAADKRNICVLLVDVDNFKQFNDQYGHDVGDLVLKRTADEMRKTFRTEDHISRIGGDEFCVIMKNATSELSYLVRAKVSALNRILSVYQDKVPPVSLSVGVAFGDRSEPENLFKDADTALYRVKQAGRSGCEIF